MCKKYYDLYELIKHYRALANIVWNKKVSPSSWSDAFEGFIEHLEGLPAADVMEVKHAYWKTVVETRDNTVCGDGVKIQYKICSRCDNPMGLTGADYCGWCGSKMDGTPSIENDNTLSP